ncbi:MAG TPA: hypothetical protein VFS40_00020 [Gemmatimonadales bacterium]|nr:hypothetical protein [Gemmatimonadales bacterium]
MLDLVNSVTPRRGFLGRVAAATAALGLGGSLPVRLAAAPVAGSAGSAGAAGAAADPKLEAWFQRIKGTHRLVFDAPAANEGFPAVWPRIYLNTMEATYPRTQGTAVLILRHHALPLAMQDELWAKYHLGEMFEIKEGETPATRNIYANITTLPLPGVGVAELVKSGVLVGACQMAIAVYSAAAAKKMNLDPETVKQEWTAGLLPGVQPVPSGVMAIGRAQELGCQYCFAG